MAKYRKKTELIEAIQWLGEESFDSLYELADADNNYGIVGMFNGKGDIAQVRTSDGIIDVKINDWVIKFENNLLSVCSPGFFETVYEKAN